MRPKTLLTLTATAALLGAFIFFFEKDMDSTDERKEAAKKVLRLETDEIVAATLRWEDETVRLVRETPTEPDESSEDAKPARQWRLEEPFQSRADGEAVESLLNQITALEKGRTLEDLSPADAGLDPPRAVLTLKRPEDRQTKIEIGAEVPASSQMLVRLDGQGPIFQVGKSLYEAVTKKPGDWRDRSLFHAERSDIRRLRYTAGETPILLAEQDGSFVLEEPLNDRADTASVDSLLASLTRLEASAFVDDPLLSPDKLGLDPARAVLDVDLDGGQSFRLEFGDRTPGGQLYARADQQLVEIAPDLASSLERPAEAWRSKSWTSLQVFAIDRFEVIEDGEDPLTVERAEADWLRGEERIPYAAASDFLYALTEAQAEEILERPDALAAGHPLESPRFTIRLGGEETEEVLKLFPTIEDHAAATVDGRAVVLRLSGETAAGLESKLRALRDAEPLPEEPAEEGGSESDA